MEISRKGIGGPKTAEGKRKVSLNAIKHGYYANSEQALQLLAEEIGRDYDDLYTEMRAYYGPMDPIEELLVRRISRAAWRMLVTEAAENRDVARTGGVPCMTSSYAEIIRNERYIDIQLHRAIHALERKRQQNSISENKLIFTRIHERIQAD